MTSRPVFIIGCPRSGTSITLDLLSAHEDFAWVSNLLNEFPRKLELSSFNRVFDSERGAFLLLKRHQVRTLPVPVEPWGFWTAYLRRFRWKTGGELPPHRHNETDITSEETKTVRYVVNAICNYQRKERFLSKYTDFPRIKYLTQAFPDALFVHVVRDGRAVAYSYYEQLIRGSWRTWEEREWWIRGWPEPWRNEWLEKYKCRLAFVAYQWMYFVNEIWEDARDLSCSQFVEVRYKELIESPKMVLANIFEKCDLRMASRVDRYADRLALTDMNLKWREALRVEERVMLNRIMKEDRFTRLFDS